jgi:hypothetical protein
MNVGADHIVSALHVFSAPAGPGAGLESLMVSLCGTANDPYKASKWVDVVEKGLALIGEQ